MTTTVLTRPIDTAAELFEVYTETTTSDGVTREARGRIRLSVDRCAWVPYDTTGTWLVPTRHGLNRDAAIAAVMGTLPDRTRTTTTKEPRTMPQVITDAITDVDGELIAVNVLNGSLTLFATDPDDNLPSRIVVETPTDLLTLASAALDAAAHMIRRQQHADPDGNADGQRMLNRQVHHAASTAHQLSGLMLGLTR